MILGDLRRLHDNFANFHILRESEPFLLTGLENTLKLVAVAFLLAMILALPLAIGALSKRPAARALANVYVDVMRSVPPVMTLLVVYYVVPSVHGPSLSVFAAAVVAFGVIQAAYVAEVYRGAYLGLRRGQLEAAASVGLTKLQMARLVMVPQLFRLAVPPLTNQVTQLVRDSALATFIGFSELLTQARSARAITSNASPLFAVAIIYGLLMLVFQLFSARVERRLYSEL